MIDGREPGWAMPSDIKGALSAPLFPEEMGHPPEFRAKPVLGEEDIHHGQADRSYVCLFDIGEDTYGCARTAQVGIPTVSQWGIVSMGLLLLTSGTVVYRRHRFGGP